MVANKLYKDSLKVFIEKAGPLFALIILGIIMTILSPIFDINGNQNFLTIANMTNIIRQAAFSSMIALAMLLAILTAGIDLSVGPMTALSAIVMALFIRAGGPPIIGIFICLLTGAVLGLLNGLLLTKLRLPHPFISTLGTQNIFRAICLILTAAAPISRFPPVVTAIGAASIPGTRIPVSIIVVIIAFVSFGFLLNHTVLGRNIYAIGGNAQTARLSGINVKRTLNIVYMLGGLMCGLAGLIVVGRADSISPLFGLGAETDAIAAVIIGGASFFGGKGTVFGTLCGVFIIAVLRNGLSILGVMPDVQQLVLGSVIILAVYFDVMKARREAQLAKKAKAALLDQE